MSASPNKDNKAQFNMSFTAECDTENDGNKTTNNKSGKPLNFLAKIALGCQQITVKSDKQKEHKNKSYSHYFHKFSEESREFKNGNGGNADRDNIDPSHLLARICSSNDSHDAATKMQLLTSLANACIQRPELYEIIGSSPLVYYTEGLLFTYIQALYMRTRCGQGVNMPGPSISELILLIPVIKLLIPAANMAVHKIRAIFLYKSEVLLQLMQASTQCSYNAISAFTKLCAAVSDKVLVGAILEMSSSDTLALFAKCFGMDASSLNMKLQGYHTTLYDTNGTDDININLDIIQKKRPSGKEYTQPLADNSNPNPMLDCCENVDNANWSDVIVAKVLLLKVLLVYTKADWKERLIYISSQVHEHLRIKDKTSAQPLIGAVYGFWSLDATFEGEALLKVQYLRGQVLTLTGDWTMFWATDVGLLGYIPKAKLYSLPEHVASQAPLISICLLRGPVCEMDEVFLESAYKLLQIILETNALTGKHMLLCESGEHILSLFEYPEAVIRIAFMNLLLCLAKNSNDVIKFLLKHHFDVTLVDKLERYSHIYTADLCSCKDSMEKEITQMVMILLAILEQENVRNWPQNRRASRVLWMFLCDKKCIWKQLMEKCLFVLSDKSKQTHIQRDSFRNGRQQIYRCDRGTRLERHRVTCLNQGRSEADDKTGMRYRGRINFSGRSGYGCGQRRQFEDDTNSMQGYINAPHSAHKQSNVQGHLESSHETHRTSPTSELDNSQEIDPKDSPAGKAEMSTKAEPETETEIFHRQQKESQDYFNSDYIHKSEVQEMMNLCSKCKHNLVGDWKPDSQEWQRDGLQANSKTNLEVSKHRLLMSRIDNNDKARRIYYGGQSRQTIHRLSMFNTLKPPSVANRVTATYHDLVSPCNDPPLDDIEPVVKQMEEIILDSETDYVICGTKATVKPDKTHELMVEKKLWDIKEVLLAEKMCGLLNNNVEGSMFFGLSADSIIVGLKLGREDKDNFRNGIDRIMNRCLIPEVQANSYDILFTPVLYRNQKAVDLTQHSLYIIEIRVHPMMHMVYMVYHGHKCFIRRDTETVEYSVQQKKQDMMDAEDKAIEESIEKIRAAVQTDLHSLAEYIKKYLPQSYQI